MEGLTMEGKPLRGLCLAKAFLFMYTCAYYVSCLIYDIVKQLAQ